MYVRLVQGNYDTDWLTDEHNGNTIRADIHVIITPTRPIQQRRWCELKTSFCLSKAIKSLDWLMFDLVVVVVRVGKLHFLG